MRSSLLFALLLASTVATPAAEPDWKTKLSSSKPGTHQPLPPGKLELDISWKGLVDSGSITMEFGKDGAHKPNTRVIQTTASSMGAAYAVFPYRGKSWVEINSTSLRPQFIEAWEKSSEETITTTSRFDKDRVTCKEVTKVPNRRTPKVEEETFAQSPVFDITSTLLHLRSQKLEKDDELSLMMHPFSTPYLMKAKVLGREKHNEQDCIRISMEMFKINRDTLELKPYKKLKEPAIMWLSDDQLRIPVEIRAKVFIGDVRVTLRGFQEA